MLQISCNDQQRDKQNTLKRVLRNSKPDYEPSSKTTDFQSWSNFFPQCLKRTTKTDKKHSKALWGVFQVHFGALGGAWGSQFHFKAKDKLGWTYSHNYTRELSKQHKWARRLCAGSLFKTTINHHKCLQSSVNIYNIYYVVKKGVAQRRWTDLKKQQLGIPVGLFLQPQSSFFHLPLELKFY